LRGTLVFGLVGIPSILAFVCVIAVVLGGICVVRLLNRLNIHRLLRNRVIRKDTIITVVLGGICVVRLLKRLNMHG
jgi:hypothetical protein